MAAFQRWPRLEIAEDRQHCSIVTAGRLRDGLVLLDLAAYLDGTQPTTTVLQLREQLTIIAVVVDPTPMRRPRSGRWRPPASR